MVEDYRQQILSQHTSIANNLMLHFDQGKYFTHLPQYLKQILIIFFFFTLQIELQNKIFITQHSRIRSRNLILFMTSYLSYKQANWYIQKIDLANHKLVAKNHF
ncbi:hypothetical protein ABPG72_010587 [Tetrahymena utriculariae]